MITGPLFFGHHRADLLANVAYTFFLSDRILALCVFLQLCPTLSQGFSAVLPFVIDRLGRYFCVGEMLGRLKVELVALEGQVKRREALGVVGDSELKRHLGVVKQPELRVKADLVKALNQRDVTANVELVLKLRVHLE